MRIVITGAFGFIGSHFAKYVSNLDEDIKILVVDKCTYAANKNNLNGITYEHLHRDICDITALDLGEYDYLINFAAESHVDNSIKDGKPFVRTNVEGTFNLLEIARQNPNLKKFIQISTDEVYGDMDSRELPSANENTSFKPSSYYSSTKAAADHLVQAAGRTYGLPYLITRTCNNFGEHQHSEKFLPTIARSIKNDNPIPLYGDGNHIREWIWVEDNVRMVYDLMISDIGIWNIGSGDSWTNKKIIEEVGLILNKKADFKYVDDRLGHDARYTIDISKLEYHYNTNNLTTKDIRKFLLERFGSSN